MAEKKVLLWAKVGVIMRDKIEDKKVIMLAKLGGIIRDNIAD